MNDRQFQELLNQEDVLEQRLQEEVFTEEQRFDYEVELEDIRQDIKYNQITH